MANTGSTDFNDAASKIEGSGPRNPVKQRTTEQLRKMHAVLPYVFDALNALDSQTSEYPGGLAFTPLDQAVLIVSLLDL